MTSPNFYDVLQIGKDANETDIKRAYRSLSLQWHPDRNPAPEAQSKFQEINEAYETLSDPAKKEMYDAELNGTFTPFGSSAFFRTSSMDGPGPNDMADINNILNMMFSGGFGNPFSQGPNMGAGPFGPGTQNVHVFTTMGPGGPEIFMQQGNPFQQSLQKPPPIIKSINITFQQAYTGCIIPIEIEKWAIIEGLQISEHATIDVVVPQGVNDKEMIIMRECGNTLSNGQKGDVKFIVCIASSPTFERQGLDLIYKKQLTLKESLCGFSFDIIHPNGKQLIMNNMTNKTVIKPGFKKVIQNMGMIREGTTTGSLIVEFSVEFPDALTPEQMKTIESALSG